MSVHLLIHAVPPPDSMLSNCQTSLKGERHHHTFLVYMIARKKLIPVNITLMDFSAQYHFQHALNVGPLCPTAVMTAAYCSLGSSWVKTPICNLLFNHLGERREKRGNKNKNINKVRECMSWLCGNACECVFVRVCVQGRQKELMSITLCCE